MQASRGLTGSSPLCGGEGTGGEKNPTTAKGIFWTCSVNAGM